MNRYFLLLTIAVLLITASCKKESVGPQGPQGQQGPQGPGGTGPQGQTGKAGNTILYGPANPISAIGIDSNFYINTSTNHIFGPKIGGQWPAGKSLVGPTGQSAVQEWGCFYEGKPSGQAAGPAAARWQVRQLNKTREINSPSGSITLSGSSVILTQGTYFIDGSAPAYTNEGNLRSVANFGTSSNPTVTPIILGTPVYNNANLSIINVFSGILVVSITSSFSIQHYFSKALSSIDALGSPAYSGQEEVYARITIHKLK